MAVNISPPVSGSTSMGCFIVCLDVSAQATLQETAVGSDKFQFQVNYSYSGTISGSGSQTFPVSGNQSGSYDGPDDVVINYSVTDWNQTSTSLSCNVTVSISHTSFPEMGPDYLFQNQTFSGPLPKVQAALNNARLQRAREIDAALHKATGVTCSLSAR